MYHNSLSFFKRIFRSKVDLRNDERDPEWSGLNVWPANQSRWFVSESRHTTRSDRHRPFETLKPRTRIAIGERHDRGIESGFNAQLSLFNKSR